MLFITNINKKLWVYRYTFAKKITTMEKEKKHQFKLIDGQYSPLEAKKILLGLINSKINLHKLDNFRSQVGFNKDDSHSRNRIEALTNVSENIKDLIAAASFDDMEFQIEGNINISLVPAKRPESVN